MISNTEKLIWVVIVTAVLVLFTGFGLSLYANQHAANQCHDRGGVVVDNDSNWSGVTCLKGRLEQK